MSTPDEKLLIHGTIEPSKSTQILGMTHSPAPNKDGLESGSIDKIRDILFGDRMREYEKRFSRLEERLVKDYSELREDTKKRLENLESYIKNEVNSLTERVNHEPVKRDEAVKELSQELKNLIDSLNKKIIQLDEQANQNQRNLRQQILELSKSIDEDLRKKSEELLVKLELEAQELRSEKTDRSTLATLFAELAMRLNNQ